MRARRIRQKRAGRGYDGLACPSEAWTIIRMKRSWVILTRHGRNQKGTQSAHHERPEIHAYWWDLSWRSPGVKGSFEQAAGSLQRQLRVQALGLTRAGKPFGNQDLSRRQSREDRSVACYRRDLKQGSGNIPRVYSSGPKISRRCAHGAEKLQR